MSKGLGEWLEPLPKLEQFRLFACFGPKFGVEEGLRIASWRLSVKSKIDKCLRNTTFL